jgi:glycosyltransferase involved in cell wall biosynthesis
MRLLWLKSGPLHPLDTGGKLRTYNMLRELSRRHEVTFLALCPPETPREILESAREYSAKQIWVPWSETQKFSAGFFTELIGNLFSPLPYVISKYRSREMTTRLAELEGKCDAVVCDFLTPAVNWRPSHVPSLLFQHNVEARIWQRIAENETRPLHRWFFRKQWQKLRSFEAESCARFDGVVTVSEEDAEAHRREYSLTNVLGAVPTGVDTEHFRNDARSPRPRSLVFLGSMDWMANQDSVLWFSAEMWPALRAQFPDLTITIVGRNPPANIRALAEQPGWTVTGTVPDVRPHLAESEILIVPLRIGGGTRIKIYEGIAAGLPVVSTSIGAEGLPLHDGEHIVLADTPAAFVVAISSLLRDDTRRNAIAVQGRDYVRANFGWSAVTDVFDNYLTAVAAKRAA